VPVVRRFAWLLQCVVVAGLARAGSQEPPAAPEAPLPRFEYEQHLLVPVRGHLLRAKTVAAANTALGDADLTRILAKVNRIWAAAGIQFYLEGRVTEEAAAQDLYQGLAENRTEAHLLLLRPRGTLAEGMFHAYFVREMAPNGIFLRRDGIFVKETAKLKPVEGGIDEALPRVLAHELGHGLDLEHRQDTLNLMASGTTGTSLNAPEVDTARAAAARLGWARAPAELDQLTAAQDAARGPRSVDVDRCLAAIPGQSPLRAAARARLGME
jgi:hypothetical protein